MGIDVFKMRANPILNPIYPDTTEVPPCMVAAAS